MATYSGSSLVVTWILAASTTTLTGAHKTCSYSPAIDLIEATAGADAFKTYLNGPKSGKVSFACNQQVGSSTLGTVLAEGQAGTVKISPEGTGTGKQLITIPAISMGPQWSFPYNDVSNFSVDFTQNGSATHGTN
jgi:hypothetical protein